MLRNVSAVIYRMKRRFGVTVKVYQELQTDPNLATGAMNRDFSFFTIKYAVVLPVRTVLTYLNDGFMTTGLDYGLGSRGVLIDIKDIPSDKTLSQNDTIEYADEHYNIKVLERTAENKSIVLVITKTQEAVVGLQTFNRSLSDDLDISEAASGVVV